MVLKETKWKYKKITIIEGHFFFRKAIITTEVAYTFRCIDDEDRLVQIEWKLLNFALFEASVNWPQIRKLQRICYCVLMIALGTFCLVTRAGNATDHAKMPTIKQYLGDKRHFQGVVTGTHFIFKMWPRPFCQINSVYSWSVDCTAY